MNDIYTHYEAGVQELLCRLGQQHPAYSTALIFQQRLMENLAATRTYGDTETRRAERAEILSRLDHLTQAQLRVTFRELYGPVYVAPATTPPPTDPGPVYNINTDGGAVVIGDVTTHGGDFVGRDSHSESRHI